MKEKVIQELLQNYKTPLYVFDIHILKERIAYLRRCLKADLCYAVKANTFILKEICDDIDRFEVCSEGELRICESMQLPMSKIVLSGVYKNVKVIRELIKKKKGMGIFTIESMRQYELLKEAAQQNHVSISLLLRLTSGNQFGLNEEEIFELIQDASNIPYIEIKGIQYFSGTQKKSLKKLEREISYLDNFLLSLSDKTGFVIQELEFGPGFPISYFESDDYDEEAFLKGFSDILESMTYKTVITLELGRSIAASCGYYLTRVVDMKMNKNQRYAIVDGGIHHLVYYGQSMAMKLPKYEMYPSRNSSKGHSWNICGSLCTINDILVKQLTVADLACGDVLIFKNTGAYCMTEGISLFLSRDLPAVIKIDEDGSFSCIREVIRTDLINMPSKKGE